MSEPRMTSYNPAFKARYGLGGWDDPRPTSECLHCRGTGMADENNECGFCFPGEQEVE